MRGRTLAALALAVLLSGCSWMDGSYVSVTPHEVAQSQTGEGITGTVSNYAELRSALVRMVDEGSTEALFTLEAYPRDVAQEDVDRAVEYVTKIYPIGSYAVASIDTEVGTGALSVDITYSHTAQELAGIRTVRGMDGAEKAIAEALDECADKLVLQISGFRDVDYN